MAALRCGRPTICCRFSTVAENWPLRTHYAFVAQAGSAVSRGGLKPKGRFRIADCGMRIE